MEHCHVVDLTILGQDRLFLRPLIVPLATLVRSRLALNDLVLPSWVLLPNRLLIRMVRGAARHRCEPKAKTVCQGWHKSIRLFHTLVLPEACCVQRVRLG